MKRYQKLIAMALAAVLCLGIFAGCSSTDYPSAATPEGFKGILLEATNELREYEGLKPLTYSETLSAKAEEIIKLFQQNEEEAYWDDYWGLLLEGECFYGTLDEKDLLFGAWDEIDNEGHAVRACLWNQYGDSNNQLVLKAEIVQTIMGEDRDMMNAQISKVGFAFGKVNGKNYWIAVMK